MKNYLKTYLADIIYDVSDIPTLKNQAPYYHRYIYITAYSLTAAWCNLYSIITDDERQQAANYGMPIVGTYLNQI